MLSSEIFTTRAGRKKFQLKVACWDVRIWLQKGILENINARLGINVLRISEERWPGEDDYKNDYFRIIYSRAGNG